MRIVHIITRLIVGGAQENTLLTCRGLRCRGHTVVVLTGPQTGPEGHMFAQAREYGLEIEVIEHLRRNVHAGHDVLGLISLVAALRRIKPDVVHTHSSKAGFLGRAAAWVCGVPRIYLTPHIFYFQYQRNRVSRMFYEGLEWLAACVTTRLVAVSREQGQLAVRFGVGRPGQVSVIENGVAAAPPTTPDQQLRKRAELGVSADEPLVGMVARLARQKGCEHYLRVARRVLDKMPSTRFVLVGEGELEERLRGMADELRLGDRFLFLGHRDDADEIYWALDLFVLTSLWEGLPYVVMEAMAAGLAVVATDVPGTRDIVRDDATGYLVDPEDEADMAERIMELLADPERGKRMGRLGKERVARRFTRDRFIREIEALYSLE